MKEHPILFSGPMVRAILAGRKTQTRRVVRPGRSGAVITGPAAHAGMVIEAWGGGQWNVPSRMEAKACPYGVPGDRLWVRETFSHGPVFNADQDYSTRLRYRANEGDSPLPPGQKWKPSIFMKRWMSRITLEVTAVRVERLQQISEEDAQAEGVVMPDGIEAAPEWWSYVAEFAFGWDGINGKRATWASNPWVWVVGFGRLEARA